MNKNWIWWKHGVIYQIYPRSFYDSNNDGIGDIPGIIEKLDYLQDLGIDGIWISPINTSPMFDFGYDISDYRGIDPVFGNEKDFNRLLKEAHRRKIHIIMDLVANHTSHLHPWFIESRSSVDNPKSDWYIWHDGINGKPPNNWLGAFGGKAWEWDNTRKQYYLHSFLIEQPDLNWRNSKMKKALYNEIRYWLDKGVDGFRLDVINFFLKDEALRNNSYFLGPRPRLYDLQIHAFDRNRPEMHDILKELRSVFDEYEERMMVGEVFSPFPDAELSSSYLGNGEDELHLAFDFSLFYKKKWDAHLIFQYISKWISLVPENGWPCHVMSNHDQPRSISRIGGGKDALKRAKIIAVLMLTLKGTPFIYYGEEIGMSDGSIKRKEIVDPVGKQYWPLHKGRDPVRTPMQWSTQKYAGFSLAKPWLPVNNNYTSVNVESEFKNNNSLLNFYRLLIALRKKSAALQQGTWTPIDDGSNNVISYYRTHLTEKMLVFLNFSAKESRGGINGSENWKVIFSTHKPLNEVFSGLPIRLDPYETTILMRIK